jgi:predicted DNA-binding transcriptional regulator AlpA
MDNDNSRTDRLAVNVADASQALGISRSSMYAEIKRGRIQTFKLAGRLLIPWTELTALMNGCMSESKRYINPQYHDEMAAAGVAWKDRAETAERDLADARWALLKVFAFVPEQMKSGWTDEVQRAIDAAHEGDGA